MKPSRHSVARACAAALIALAAWLVMTGPASADHSWSRIGRADVPAYVKAIVFPNGVLDANNPWCWGKWCAYFGTQPPVLTDVIFSTRDRTSKTFIIRLECRNPVKGVKSCSLMLQPLRGKCLFVWGAGDAPKFSIGCPQDLILE